MTTLSPRALLPLLLAAALPLGCARGPSGGANPTGPITGRQLVVTVTVRGQVNPNDYYYILFNNANDPSGTHGPIPVVSATEAGGNGFAGGAFTHYILYHPPQPQGADYGVYAISGDLHTSSYLAAPLNAQTTGNTLKFTIPLSDLATAGISTDQTNYLQINFIATNVVPFDPQYSGAKLFDALGDQTQPGQINDWITISTAQATTYQNGVNGNEPSADVVQYTGNGTYTPADQTQAGVQSLDIVGWSVQVLN